MTMRKESIKPIEKQKLTIGKDVLFLAIVFALAVGFRLFLLRFRFAVVNDEVNYLKLAAGACEHGIAGAFHPFWAPFYPLVTALFSKAGFGLEWAGKLVSVLSGALTVIVVYVFSRFHYGKSIARATALFLAFYPPFAFMNTYCLAESLYTILIMSGVTIGWILLTRKAWRWAWLVGVLFGTAYLTRPEGIGFLIVFVVLSGVVGIRLLVRNRKTDLLAVALLASIGFAVVASPYVLYLHRVVGRWTISGKMANQQGEVLAMMKNLGDTDPIRSLSDDNKSVPIDELYHTGNFIRVQQEKGGPLVRITPALFFKKYMKNMAEILGRRISVVFPTLVFVLMVLGLFGETWSPDRAFREFYLVAYVGFFWFLVIPAFHVTNRYFLPFLPICFLWAVKGFSVLTSWLESGLREWFPRFRKAGQVKGWAFGAVLFVLLTTLYIPTLVKIVSINPWSGNGDADPVELKTAGLWLRNHGKKNPIIMSRNHTVDFYAGNTNIAESVTIPKNTMDRVLAYAENRRVDYVVLNERYKRDYPHLADLFEGKDGVPGLRRIYDETVGFGLRTIVYERVQVPHAQ